MELLHNNIYDIHTFRLQMRIFYFLNAHLIILRN
jgi:hypothetical protein